VPAVPELALLEQRSTQEAGLGLSLSRALLQVKGSYDAVVFDCPPSFGIHTISAIACSTQLIMPMQTDFLALKGLVVMLRSMARMQTMRPHLLRCLVLPTMYDSRSRAALLSLRFMRAEFGELMAPLVVPMDSQLRMVWSRGELPQQQSRLSRAMLAYGVVLERLLATPTQMALWSEPRVQKSLLAL
jgi:chromosome partitioning protein